jgi:hypothetical protein
MCAVVRTAASMRDTVLETGIIVWIARISANRGNGAVGHPRNRIPAPRTQATKRDTTRVAMSERRRHALFPAANTPRHVAVMETSTSRGIRDICTQRTYM